MRYYYRIMSAAMPFSRFEILEEKEFYLRSVLYDAEGPADIIRGIALEGHEAVGVYNPRITFTKLSATATEFITQWG